MTRRQKITIAALVPYVIMLIITTHIPIPDIVYRANVSDKWLHFLAYLNLIFLLWFSIRPDSKASWRRPLAWSILIAACAYGGIDEFIQPYFGRTKDFYDFVANTEGALTGFVIFTFMTFWQALLMVLAITIFSVTNLEKADLSKLVPVVDALFHFFAYAAFTLTWIKFMNLYLLCKSTGLRLLLALVVPIGLLLIVKAGSILLGRHFGLSDLFFATLGIVAVVAALYLAGFLRCNRQPDTIE